MENILEVNHLNVYYTEKRSLFKGKSQKKNLMN